MKEHSIRLFKLPKVSLNAWYSGNHWSSRVKIKNNFKHIIKSQFNHVFRKDSVYDVEYRFSFKTKPLDASNCVAMVKLIEDTIFEDDKYNIIKSIKITSRKAKKDFLDVKIIEESNE